MKKLNYLLNFITSYKKIFLKVIFYEIIYSLKFRDFSQNIKIHNDKSRTDTVPCIFYFLHQISKFIKNNNIRSVVDIGSGFGRVINFINIQNKIKCYGIEYDHEVYKKSLKYKNKSVKLYCGDVFKFRFENFNSRCFILVDPFKKKIEIKKIFNKIRKISPKKNKYIIAVNINKKKISKEFNLLYSIKASETRRLDFYKTFKSTNL